MRFDDFWQYANETTFLGSTPAHWAAALLVTVLTWLALTLVLRVALRRIGAWSRHTATDFDDLVVDVLSATRHWVLFLVSLLVGLHLLELPTKWDARVSQLWFVLIVVQIALWVSRALMLILHRKLLRTANLAEASASATLLSWALQTALWTTVLLAVLANLGVNITALVTSLGVGGIAVALAVQNVLGDLFASLSIALDKPFEVGDSIAVKDSGVSGTVERVGLKTTRIRALGGEQIVVSNADLLKSAVSNYKRQQTRRIQFKFSVGPDTTAAQARAIPEMVQKIVETLPQVSFDRAHLQNITDGALEYEVVYIVQASDYKLYMDNQQQIYLQLIEQLHAAGVRFATPRPWVQQATAAAKT